MGETLTINKIKLYVETFGEQTDPAIILISGAMAPATFWPTSFCETIANGGRFVIRFDNRDMGYSTHFPPCRPDTNSVPPYTINDMVTDVAGILDHFNIKTVTPIGHSLGGSIAQLFAVQYPERVRELFILSSPILAYGNNQYIKTDEKILGDMWDTLMANKMYPDFARGEEEFLKIWKYLNGRWELDQTMAHQYTERIYATETIEPAWNHTAIQEGIPDIFNKLNNPKLAKHFIHGELDYLPADPANVKTLTESLTNADLQIIPNGGHMFFNKQLWEMILNHILNKLA